MAPRYEAALGVLRDIANGDDAAPPETTALLAELKGIACRCLRRTRVDWLSVWRLLGSADRDRLSDLADLAQRTRQAIGSDTPGLRAALTDDPAFRHWTDALDRARDELRHRMHTGPETGTDRDGPLDRDRPPARAGDRARARERERDRSANRNANQNRAETGTGTDSEPDTAPPGTVTPPPTSRAEHSNRRTPTP